MTSGNEAQMTTSDIITSSAVPATQEWSDEELDAAIDAYLSMLRSELAGRAYNKSEINRHLRAGKLSSRTRASIEFRMQNISATLYDLRMPRIAGYLPAKNVGSSVKERIRLALQNQGITDLLNYVPTASERELSARVSALLSQPMKSVPQGAIRPEQVSVSSMRYVRDPAIKAWVLEEANGTCEGCMQPAPFVDDNGNDYLEVHHLMPLASHGSDRTSNAIALCPNCHRRCHYSKDRDEFKLALYERIGRLRIEVPDSGEEIGQHIEPFE